ncbi:MAG TPA: hypothetical protein IGS52_11260 [Oscillatoriaceae cyanobacterium M33_DOE_052]|uniref:Uncharacterized protein n=1 Tax=Planktothricoides sp. SpSt-374 TaxID=2282167 RepID=A0A7C3ZN80_9CYAN|nr:hypothetical protein [Oscillatoriaceae cyanobacterium M33_DOE_052]
MSQTIIVPHPGEASRRSAIAFTHIFLAPGENNDQHEEGEASRQTGCPLEAESLPPGCCAPTLS